MKNPRRNHKRDPVGARTACGTAAHCAHLRRRGAAAVEFAIVCPLMLLLALAGADFGRVSHFHQVVENAARVGCDNGATQQYTTYSRPWWEANVRDAVIGEMGSIPDFDESEMTYDLATTLDSDGVARVSVEITYPFCTIVAWPGLPTETRLHKRVEFRQFR